MPFPDHSPTPAEHEARHPSAGPGWSERHRLLAAADDGSSALALSVAIGTEPSRDVASFHCVVFRSERPPIVIVDHEVEAPDELLELRTSGLWADTICESPHAHWSYGLEAFGLAIDDPEELLGRGYGDRVPLGWELDFESDPDRVVDMAGGYSQPGRLDGLLLYGEGQATFSGPAVRQHWWGLDYATAADSLDRRSDPDPESFIPGRGSLIDEVALPVGTATDPRHHGVWWIGWTGTGLRSRLDR